MLLWCVFGYKLVWVSFGHFRVCFAYFGVSLGYFVLCLGLLWCKFGWIFGSLRGMFRLLSGKFRLLRVRLGYSRVALVYLGTGMWAPLGFIEPVSQKIHFHIGILTYLGHRILRSLIAKSRRRDIKSLMIWLHYFSLEQRSNSGLKIYLPVPCIVPSHFLFLTKSDESFHEKHHVKWRNDWAQIFTFISIEFYKVWSTDVLNTLN